MRRRYAAPLCAASPRTRGAAGPLRWTLAPLRVARGMAAPRFGHGPAADAAWRGLRRGLAIPRPAVTPAASTTGLRVELARWRSLASASGVALAYARRSNPPRTADFQRRLSVRAFQAHFLSKSVAFGPMEAPATQFCPKNGLQSRCKAAWRGLMTAPGTVPTAQTRSGLGSGLRPSSAWSLNPLGIFNSPRIRLSLARNAPVSPEHAIKPRPRDRKNDHALRRTQGGSG